ncbi:MAG: hypothetical protein MJ252_22255 [archaeon]|nr:hypothetical protein [archaeon]
MIIKVSILFFYFPLELGTVVLVMSAALYGIGILLFFDRGLLLLANILFIIGFYILVGFKETVMFFGRRIQGTIALFCGLVFIGIRFKILGVIFQLYGVYVFFKKKLLDLLSYFEFLPIIGGYIRQLRLKTNIKKSDDEKLV